MSYLFVEMLYLYPIMSMDIGFKKMGKEKVVDTSDVNSFFQKQTSGNRFILEFFMLHLSPCTMSSFSE